MTRWFRWYEGTTEDGKFRVIARMSRVTVRDVISVWAFLLEDASNLEHRGVCTRSQSFISAMLDFKEGVAERIISGMQSVGMLSVSDATITICNFNKRQFESDIDSTAARRKREQRARDAASGHPDVTRDTGGSDTDTDTDTDKKKSGGPKKVRTTYSDIFEKSFWVPYPRTPIMSKAEAWREWLRLEDGDREKAIAALPRFQSWLSANPTHPAVHACRFLSQRRFEGFDGRPVLVRGSFSDPLAGII